MMEARIINWTASNSPMQLRITVGVEPLGNPKTYVWKYNGTSFSASVWGWHYENGEQLVIGNDAKELLTELVRQHSTLNLLLDYFRIPKAD